LGIAFRNQPPEVLNIAATTPQLARSLAGEKLLRVAQLPQADAEEALRVGKVALVAEPGANGAVVYAYDPTNPEGRSARMLADGAVERAAGRADLVTSADRLIEEPGSRYIDFLIPGLLGMNLMGSAMWGMGFSIVDARRKKLIKRMVATPMPRHFYLLSFVLSRLLLLVVEVGVVLGFGALVFHVPVRGPFTGLAVLCVLGSMLFCSLGLLTASRVQTIEAASGLMNAVMMPMWICSGEMPGSSGLLGGQAFQERRGTRHAARVSVQDFLPAGRLRHVEGIRRHIESVAGQHARDHPGRLRGVERQLAERHRFRVRFPGELVLRHALKHPASRSGFLIQFVHVRIHSKSSLE
jgi:hypothetical protein